VGQWVKLTGAQLARPMFAHRRRPSPVGSPSPMGTQSASHDHHSAQCQILQGCSSEGLFVRLWPDTTEAEFGNPSFLGDCSVCDWWTRCEDGVDLPLVAITAHFREFFCFFGSCCSSSSHIHTDGTADWPYAVHVVLCWVVQCGLLGCELGAHSCPCPCQLRARVLHLSTRVCTGCCW